MLTMDDWHVTRKTIEFFEEALIGHSRVASFTRDREIVFHIERTERRTDIVAVLVNLYTVGLADVFAICKQFPDVDCIVTGSNWNSYTKEAKDHGLKNKIGVFNTSEFFGALRWSKAYKYVKKDDQGRPIQSYRSA
jgi:hypothetical protein